eukprot:g20762.t1
MDEDPGRRRRIAELLARQLLEKKRSSRSVCGRRPSRSPRSVWTSITAPRDIGTRTIVDPLPLRPSGRSRAASCSTWPRELCGACCGTAPAGAPCEGPPGFAS